MKVYVQVKSGKWEPDFLMSALREEGMVDIEVSEELYQFLVAVRHMTWQKSGCHLEAVIAGALSRAIEHQAFDLINSQDRAELSYWEKSKNPAKIATHRKNFIEMSKRGVYPAKEIVALIEFYDRIDSLAKEMTRVMGTATLLS